MSAETKIVLPTMEGRSALLAGAPTLSVPDEEYRSIRRARVRIFMGVAVFSLVFFLLVARLAEVSMFRAPRVITNMVVNEMVQRADIIDRNGELLATSLATYSLFADAREVWDPVASTEAITAVFPDLDAAVIEERLSSKKAFIWVKRNLSPRERQAAFELGLPELGFRIEPRRVYPRGRLAAHVLGFTDIDMNGTAGAERAFNEALSAQGAAPVPLSIDMRVQFVLDEQLRMGMVKYEALAASGVVVNIKTGEILAMVSLPDYDPNLPGAAEKNELLNRASMQPYELGSTFKPITMALALETGVIQEGELLQVQNKLVVRKKSIKDDHPSHEPLGLYDVLAQSSNRGAAILALRAGPEAQQDLLRRLGLFSRVPFELKESTSPIVAREWQDITTVTVSYGHGISVTPLALTTALAALLNDGLYVQPTLTRRAASDVPSGRRVISKATSDEMVKMMRYVVTNGTGRNAAVSGYEIMGKTGTAEKLIDGAYDKKRLVTSFVAAFPARDPEYLVYVVYDEPKAYEGSYGYATAGWNAAKTAGPVVERIAPILGVKRTIKITQSEQLAAGGGR